MREDFRERLADLGFSVIEIGVIEFVLLRMGMLPVCDHIRPKFIECSAPDENEDGNISEERWQKFMREVGFPLNAIELAEQGLFGDEAGTC